MGKADLHIHTYYSDGQSSPGAIVEKAGKMGYSDIAITDHDGIGGVKEAVDAGRKNGVRVIPCDNTAAAAKTANPIPTT